MERITYFNFPDEFREWLEKHHEIEQELWVGYYKKGTGLPSMTWSESVDEALCFGWIDGLGKSVDDKRYKIRFTPRKRTSHWSDININKIKQLQAQGRMRESGLRAFRQRDKKRSRRASYEQKSVKFPVEYEERFKKNREAWKYFRALALSYRKMCIWWLISAKQVSTKERRFKVLEEASERGELIRLLKWGKKKK